MSDDGKRQVVNHYHFNIQGATLGDQQHGNRTDISGSKIETVLAGAEASGHIPAQAPSNANALNQPSTKGREVRSDSSTRREIPLLRDKEQTKVVDVGEKMEMMKVSDSRVSILNDRARFLLAKSDYEGVAKLLDDPVITSSGDFIGKALLAETYLMLGREAKALKVIEALKKVLMTSQMSGSDVKAYADNLAANSAHVRAMILFPMACDMFHANTLSPDDAVNRINECISEMDDSVEALIKEGDRARIVATDVGIDYMEKMYNNMSSIENANPGNKVVKEAWALHRIGSNYFIAGQYENSLKSRCRGVEHMEQQFRGKESMYQVYGSLLHNIGVAHFNLGKFTEAEKYYHKAVKARESATDYSSESEKREYIELSRTDLNDTRAKLRKK